MSLMDNFITGLDCAAVHAGWLLSGASTGDIWARSAEDTHNAQRGVRRYLTQAQLRQQQQPGVPPTRARFRAVHGGLGGV